MVQLMTTPSRQRGFRSAADDAPLRREEVAAFGWVSEPDLTLCIPADVLWTVLKAILRPGGHSPDTSQSDGVTS